MRGYLEAVWIPVKSWLASIGSRGPRVYLALFPLVVASLLGWRENQAFLSPISLAENLSANAPRVASLAALSELWPSIRTYIGSIVAPRQEGQPDSVSFADMQLRHDSLFPFDATSQISGPMALELDPNKLDNRPLATVPLPPFMPGSSAAQRAAEALVDRATSFDLDGFVSETMARRALVLSPASSRAKLVLGKILANRDDESGVVMLMQVADHDPRLVAQVRPFIDGFAQRHGSDPYAQRTQAIVGDWAKIADLAIEERSTSTGALLLPSTLDEDNVAQIKSCVPTAESIGSAQIVRKSVVRWIELPAYVIVLDTASEIQRQAIASCIESLRIDASIAVLSAVRDQSGRRSVRQLSTDNRFVPYHRKS